MRRGTSCVQESEGAPQAPWPKTPHAGHSLDRVPSRVGRARRRPTRNARIMVLLLWAVCGEAPCADGLPFVNLCLCLSFVCGNTREREASQEPRISHSPDNCVTFLIPPCAPCRRSARPGAAQRERDGERHAARPRPSRARGRGARRHAASAERASTDARCQRYLAADHRRVRATTRPGGRPVPAVECRGARSDGRARARGLLAGFVQARPDGADRQGPVQLDDP